MDEITEHLVAYSKAIREGRMASVPSLLTGDGYDSRLHLARIRYLILHVMETNLIRGPDSKSIEDLATAYRLLGE